MCKIMKYDIKQKRKELAKILLNKMLIEMYSKKHKLTFDKAFSQCVKCGFYDSIFDDKLEYWKEGPTFLVEELERYLKNFDEY